VCGHFGRLFNTLGTLCTMAHTRFMWVNAQKI
jgi:hypothetical protein